MWAFGREWGEASAHRFIRHMKHWIRAFDPPGEMAILNRSCAHFSKTRSDASTFLYFKKESAKLREWFAARLTWPGSANRGNHAHISSHEDIQQFRFRALKLMAVIRIFGTPLILNGLPERTRTYTCVQTMGGCMSLLGIHIPTMGFPSAFYALPTVSGHMILAARPSRRCIKIPSHDARAELRHEFDVSITEHEAYHISFICLFCSAPKFVALDWLSTTLETI